MDDAEAMLFAELEAGPAPVVGRSAVIKDLLIRGLIRRHGTKKVEFTMAGAWAWQRHKEQRHG